MIRVFGVILFAAALAAQPQPAVLYSKSLGIGTGAAIAVDRSGNAYVTGNAVAGGITPTAGAYSAVGGAFVIKLNASGTVAFATFIGDGIPTAIAVDASGNAYITGTPGPTYPTTNGAYRATPPGLGDVFVTKVNSTGTALVYSTMLGGSGNDTATGIAVDSSGNAVIVGNTTSTDFPTTAGAYKTSPAKVFVTKLNSSGSGLVFSTYFGGTAADCAYGVTMDALDNIYFTGQANTGFPITAGAYSTGIQGTSGDAFAVKMSASGGLIYSSVFGGTGTDRGSVITVDASGNAYVLGYTAGASSFPYSLWPSSPGFLMKLDPQGASRVFSKGVGSTAVLGAGLDPDTNVVVLNGDGGAYLRTEKADGSGVLRQNLANGPRYKALAVDAAGSAYALSDLAVYKLNTGPSPVLSVMPPNSSSYSVVFSGASCTPDSAIVWTGWNAIAAPAGTTCTVEVKGIRGAALWSDGSTANPRTVVMPSTNTLVSLTVIDSTSSVTITTSVLPPGAGTVTLSPNPIRYQPQAPVTATARAADGYVFGGWTGIQTSTQNALYFYAPVSDGQLTANFFSAGSCTYGFGRTTLTVPATAQTVQVDVTASPGCQWVPISNQSWIGFSSSGSFAGNTTLNVTVGANSGAVSRTGMIRAGSATLSIVQSTDRSFVSISDFQPSGAFGARNTLTLTLEDSLGLSDFGTVAMIIQDALYPQNGCYLEYLASSRQYRLLNDAGTQWSAFTGSASPSNSSCIVNSIGATSTSSRLTLAFDITLSNSFTGKKNVYINAYSASGQSSDWIPVGAWWRTASSTFVPRYRLYDPFTHSHMYTADFNEYTVLGRRGFSPEGLDGGLLQTSLDVAQGVGLFRMYNSSNRTHYWTSDRADYFTRAKSPTMSSEGVEGMILTSGPGSNYIPVYRLKYGFADELYHWTIDLNEYSTLLSRGWAGQGIMGYIVKASAVAAQGAAQRAAMISDARLDRVPVAPGQRVRIVGRDLDASRITVNGAPVESIGGSGSEIVAVLPEAMPQSGAFQVEVDGVPSDRLDAVAVNPAIFAADHFGRGLAVAEFGEGVVTFYATGVNLISGATEVRLGGFRAEIVSMERQSAGKWAITVRLPDGYDATEPARLRLRIGESWSQSGVVLKAGPTSSR